MEFTLSAAPERYSAIAIALGAEPKSTALETARAGVELLKRLIRDCGLPASLAEVNVPFSAIEAMRKPNDITLKEGIGKLLNVYKLKGKFDETSVVALWPELMGKAIANRTTQIYVSQKKLFVRIESSVIKNELLMVRSGIIQKINERAGSEVITDIVFL